MIHKIESIRLFVQYNKFERAFKEIQVLLAELPESMMLRNQIISLRSKYQEILDETRKYGISSENNIQKEKVVYQLLAILDKIEFQSYAINRGKGKINNSNRFKPKDEPSKGTGSLKIFISYAIEDQQDAMKIYSKLKDANYNVWLDKKKLLPGQNWVEKIKRSLIEAQVVIICLSKISVTKKGFYQKEIKIALDLAEEFPEDSIFIIPVRLEECNVPFRLSHIHYVDYFRSEGFEKLIEALQMV